MERIDPLLLYDEDDPSRPKLVSSSAISYVRWVVTDEIGQMGTLYVTLLVDGQERGYGGVSLDTFQRLLAAESKGRFYNKHIRPLGLLRE